jgi:hypothetical protein
MRNIDLILWDIYNVQEEINKEYWLFTRTAQGKPPRHELYIRRTELEKELEEAKEERRKGTVIT